MTEQQENAIVALLTEAGLSAADVDYQGVAYRQCVEICGLAAASRPSAERLVEILCSNRHVAVFREGLTAVAKRLTQVMGAAVTSILIIEDNPDDADHESVVAQSVGTPTILATLSAAESVLKTTPYDLVIVDLCLPDSKGMDTVRAIRRLHSGPAIAVSAFPTADFREELQRLRVSCVHKENGRWLVGLREQLRAALHLSAEVSEDSGIRASAVDRIPAATRLDDNKITDPLARKVNDWLGVFNGRGLAAIISAVVLCGVVWGARYFGPDYLEKIKEESALAKETRQQLQQNADILAKMAFDMEHRRADFAAYEAKDSENSRALRERFDEAYQTMKEATKDRKETNQLLEKIIENQQKAKTDGKTSGVGQGDWRQAASIR